MLEQADPVRYERMLNLMGVGVIESLQRKQAYGVRYQAFEGIRLRLAPCGRIASEAAQARSLVVDGELDFDKIVVLEGLSALPQDDCQLPERMLEPPVDQEGGANPNRSVFQISLEAPAWLVISDVWYPGWRARVDGNPTRLLRANYLFRAVRVPAGEHRIVVDYRPPAFWVGAGISLLSIAVAVFIYNRHRRPVESRGKPAEQIEEGG